ncbi:MAG: tetratricopeptide repeat protein [Chloroflexi bacterium]|nr:tetratricopeptide repeat protein [Chloroflexota bacterium]
MSSPDKKYWQNILQQQSINNVTHWLDLIYQSDDSTTLIANEYENLLRALEGSLRDINSFSLGYQLIQMLHSTVLDFADWDRWLVYLNQAYLISQKRKDLLQTAKLLEQIGDVHYRMGHLEKAEVSLKNSAQKYRSLNSSTDYAHILAKLAVLFDLQGRMHEGVTLCEEALSISEKTNDLWGVAQVYLNLSHIYNRAREWEKSLDASQKSYDLFQQVNSPKEATKALINMVSISAEVGNWRKVNELSDELMDELISTGDVSTLSSLKNNLGVLAFNQKNFPSAEIFWQEALVLHSQIQEPTMLASLYNNLGMVYTKMEEWAVAEDMLKKAINAYKGLGDTYNWANSMDNLADLFEVRGETAVFQATLQSAIVGLHSIKDTPHAKQLLDSMTQRIASSHL